MSKVGAGTGLLNRVHELPIAEADVRLFISVADHGSFTAAAALHDITPSAASKAVTRLEAALGVRLLVRTTRSLHLTEQGAAFHGRCVRAYELLAQAAEEATSGAGELSGTVRIGLPPLFGTYFVAARLGPFLESHPRLKIELFTTMRSADVVERGLDFMIAVGTLADSSLVARPLGYGQYVTIASPAYLASRGRPASPEDLAQHRCLAWTRPDQREEPWHFLREGAPAPFQPAGSVKSDDMHHLAALAKAGAGIAHLPLFVVADALESQALQPLLGAYAPAPKLASFLYPDGRAMPRRVRAVIEYLLQPEHLLPGTASGPGPVPL